MNPSLRHRTKRFHAPSIGVAVLLSFGLTALAAWPAQAAPGDVRWVARYSGVSGAGGDPAAIAASPDGTRIFVTGTSPGHLDDFATVAYDAATGAQLWAARYDGPAHGDDLAADIAVSPDGSKVFVTGQSADSNASTGFIDWAYETLAYDAATGTRLWARRYDVAGQQDVPVAVAVNPKGTLVYVSGHSGGWTGIAYSLSTGDRKWLKHDSSHSLGSMAVSHDGSKLFLIEDHGAGSGVVFGFKAGTGAQLWTADFGANASAVTGAPDSKTVFVSGLQWGVPHEPITTTAYNSTTGATRWVASHDGGVAFTDAHLAVSPDGAGVIVAALGQSQRKVPSSGDFITIAYAPKTGQQLWYADFDSTPRLELTTGVDDTPSAVAVAPDSSQVFVMGTSCPSDTGGGICDQGIADYGTVAYDAVTGSQLWTRAYSDSSNSDDEASSGTVTPAGPVITGGSCVPDPNTGDCFDDYVTVAYSSS
ncbi:MAG TPA: PQQ-binding-like beta-propeller repeat protein [Actinomycetota bacterium]